MNNSKRIKTTIGIICLGLSILSCIRYFSVLPLEEFGSWWLLVFPVFSICAMAWCIRGINFRGKGRWSSWIVCLGTAGCLAYPELREYNHGFSLKNPFFTTILGFFLVLYSLAVLVSCYLPEKEQENYQERRISFRRGDFVVYMISTILILACLSILAAGIYTGRELSPRQAFFYVMITREGGVYIAATVLGSIPWLLIVPFLWKKLNIITKIVLSGVLLIVGPLALLFLYSSSERG